MQPRNPEAALGAHDLEVVEEGGRRTVRSATRRQTVARRPTVTYYRRMLSGRLYPLTVKIDGRGSLDEVGRSAADEAVLVVQPVIAGAQVTPVSAELNPINGGEARFWVLPMCRGRLKGTRVDFRSGGRVVASMPLGMKVGRRRLTWLLAFLTIALPLLVIYVKDHPGVLKPPITAYLGVVKNKDAAPPPAAEKPSGKPSTDKPAGDNKPNTDEVKPADKPAAKPEDKPLADKPATGDAKPDEESKPAKPEETKPMPDPAKPGEDKPAGTDAKPAGGEKPAKPEETKPMPDAAKPGEDKPGETEAKPAGGEKPARSRRGGGGGLAAPGNAVSGGEVPPVKPRKPLKPAMGGGGLLPPPEFPYHAQLKDGEAFEKHIENRSRDEANRAKFLFAGLDWAKPWPRQAYEALQNFLDMPFPELFLFAFLLLLTILCAALQSSYRSRKTGPQLEIAV